ncbi:MAG: eukaryotic-like serine/threonine-protein kinase [Solirubrobacteraceae bacterium]|nr:eukaryotic-like serine/threonine-protein kinase [Solirubrobacteraceae bacterium]
MRAGEHPPPGTRIANRYTIVKPISSGSMGAVYRAHDDNGPDVALKHLTDTTQAARFEIESRLLGRLRHPRVVRVHGPVLDHSDRWLAMDLVDGPDMAKLIGYEGNPGLPEADVLEWTRQACEALDYVHAQQVLHRDIKPANLMLGSEGVVLVDFGIARTLDPLDDQTRGIGTPRYMAPEVAAGHRSSPRSDVYSMAATIWALLTGAPPTPDAAAPSPALERPLRAALHPRPERRPDSAAALATALGVPLATSLSSDTLAVSFQPDRVLDAVVRAIAAAFDAASVSIAVENPVTGDLRYLTAWGAGAREIIGVRLPKGTGLGGSVAASGRAEAVPDVRTDGRFAREVAEATGYVPHTMLVVPFGAGVLSILDRRDGKPYTEADLPRAQVFADLAAAALD